MRKQIIFAIAFCLIMICICSCGSTDVPSRVAAEDTYTKGPFISENKAMFNALIEDNPIDKAYLAEITGDTTEALIENELKYARIWAEEMDFSCTQLEALMSKSAYNEFTQIQKEWKHNLESDYRFVYNTFCSNQAEVVTGTHFSVDCATQYHNAIKERALYIKYLWWVYVSNANFRFEEAENIPFAFNQD